MLWNAIFSPPQALFSPKLLRIQWGFEWLLQAWNFLLFCLAIFEVLLVCAHEAVIERTERAALPEGQPVLFFSFAHLLKTCWPLNVRRLIKMWILSTRVYIMRRYNKPDSLVLLVTQVINGLQSRQFHEIDKVIIRSYVHWIWWRGWPIHADRNKQLVGLIANLQWLDKTFSLLCP